MLRRFGVIKAHPWQGAGVVVGNGKKWLLSTVESQIQWANALLSRTPSVHPPMQSHKQRGKAQQGEKEKNPKQQE